jgi:hypothetical protein
MACAKLRRIMPDPGRQHRLTKSLQLLSTRLDDLLLAINSDPQQLPLDLLDELANSIGELMLTLKEHLVTQRSSTLTQQLLVNATQLRQDVRAQALSFEQLIIAVDALKTEVTQLIWAEKQAA